MFGGSTKLATEGLTDWRNVIKVVKQHEVSNEHTNCQIVFLRRSNNIGRIYSDLCVQITNEIDYWKNVLKRVIAVIKKLGSRGLPFRGSMEKFGSQNNDSTPDISHTDQLAYVIRYVRDDGFPVERFMCFLPNVEHKSEALEMAVMSLLTINDIDINNCRGQSYENAANMSGIYSGLQSEKYEFDKVRTKKRKLQAGETRENEVHMTGSDKLRIGTYFSILDRVKSEIEKRCAAYINTFGKYNFLTNLILLSPEEITQKANKLQEFYNVDLEKSFACECVHFRAYLQSINKNIDGVNELSILLRGNNLYTVFPNVDIALRMLLCMAITNSSAESSFSTLKRIKNYLRASMEGDKLNSLSLLTIETELVNKMDFDVIVDDYATQKSRRKPMSTRH
ncbi:uncharacterized protein LOC126837489 [Adelges cooleyi]|uniref:uncharacterized protein LOC126837489 n=1 Tax=Adelges cooleyi TaxID=133065 RepID=UPI00217F8BCC|nr:uncharacterized protein LOC126837489 [Adelges cooleyi]